MRALAVLRLAVAASSVLVLTTGAAPAAPSSTIGEIAYAVRLLVQGAYDGAVNDDGALEDDLDICVRNVSGGDRRLTGLTPVSAQDFESGPRWAPGGRRLAYIVRGGIVIAEADGRDPAMIPGTEGAFNLTFAPTGDVLAFETEGREIKTVRVDGSQLTTIKKAAIEPAWSPDGTRIAYVEPGRGLLAMDPDGSNSVTLASGVTLAPAWSPDGRTIAFVAERGRRDWIERVNADGGGRMTLREIRNTLGSYPTVDWSPDGSKIAFVQDRPDGRFTDVYLMDADGSHLTNVTNTPFDEYDPVWRPVAGADRPARDGAPCGVGGTPRGEVLRGSRWADYVDAIGGNDQIETYAGRDVVYGGAGNDTILAGAGVDVVFGEGGDDRIFGQGARDIVSGGDGNDRIVGGSGWDAIHGDAGDDVILARDGERDGVHCGPGWDVVYADRVDRVSTKTCEVIRFR